MMPRFRSGMGMRPVHRIKHVVDIQNAATAGAVSTNNIIQTVDAPVLANVIEVETGSKVNAIYLKVELYARTAGALSNAYLIVFKNPGGNLTLPGPATVGGDDNKRYVIHQEMVMLQRVVNGNPRTLFNGVIMLPRGYRRMGPGDFLQLGILAPGVDIDFCIQAHYKEFR